MFFTGKLAIFQVNRKTKVSIRRYRYQKKVLILLPSLLLTFLTSFYAYNAFEYIYILLTLKNKQKKISIHQLIFWGLVMGSIGENRYWYSTDTLATVSIVSILVALEYPSKNLHHELHIHKLVTYFDFRTSNYLGFFNICPIYRSFPF